MRQFSQKRVSVARVDITLNSPQLTQDWLNPKALDSSRKKNHSQYIDYPAEAIKTEVYNTINKASLEEFNQLAETLNANYEKNKGKPMVTVFTQFSQSRWSQSILKSLEPRISDSDESRLQRRKDVLLELLLDNNNEGSTLFLSLLETCSKTFMAKNQSASSAAEIVEEETSVEQKAASDASSRRLKFPFALSSFKPKAPAEPKEVEQELPQSHSPSAK